MTKRYDRAYFDKWYRNRRTRVATHADVRRKVSLAVASCEYFLRRPLRSVLDVGCGEAAWLPHLRALRPNVKYLGLDPSEYVVERFGRTRNIRHAAFGELPSLRLGSYDLVVCSDVLHYVPEGEIRAGAAEIARIAEGLAYIEVLTKEDEIVGDLQGLLQRPAAFYRNLFHKCGMMAAGPYCWLPPSQVPFAAELELTR